MRVHTLFAAALAAFAAPAGAAEPSRPMPAPVAPGVIDAPADRCVSFEVRVLKVPAGFAERTGLAGETVTLSDAQLQRALEAAQAHRETTITQFPKVTAAGGRTAQLQNRETRYFVTGVEATRVKGATVFVPKNRPIELGDVLAITGTVSADGASVRVAGGLTRVRIEGEVELMPIVTQITPVFEGGSQGTPIPFTQYLQVPDVRTERVEKSATVPAGATLVLGGWKETDPTTAPPTKGKGLLKRESKEKPAEYEVVVLATVRVLRDEPAPSR